MHAVSLNATVCDVLLCVHKEGGLRLGGGGGGHGQQWAHLESTFSERGTSWEFYVPNRILAPVTCVLLWLFCRLCTFVASIVAFFVAFARFFGRSCAILRQGDTKRQFGAFLSLC